MNYITNRVLLEKSRQELIQKSERADKTKAYGTTRWNRGRKIKPFAEVKNYNKIDFNALFKANILNFIIPVHGDRDLGSKNDYDVEVVFEGICDGIKKEFKANNRKLEYKVVYKGIIKAIKSGDVLVFCTCPDFKYRQAYWSTRGQYNAGKPELRPSNITNPNDTKGAGCKHIMSIIGDLNWAVKLGTSINNYIFYMKDNYEDKFANIIWPAITDIPYEKAFDTGIIDELADTVPTLNSEGEYGEDDTGQVDNVIEPEEEPEDFDKEVVNKAAAEAKVTKGGLVSYYIKYDHTKEETQKRFNLTSGELDYLLDKYNIIKEGDGLDVGA